MAPLLQPGTSRRGGRFAFSSGSFRPLSTRRPCWLPRICACDSRASRCTAGTRGRACAMRIDSSGFAPVVNWPSGCGFIHAGRCMIGDYSELTFRSSAHAIMRAKAAPISARSSRTSPGTRLVVARNLTFEDRRHARTWRIDFWPCDIKNRLQHIAAVEEEFALFFCSHTI